MSRTLEPEDRISHYRIVGPLGAGGMGEVYIAQDETLGRSVALKILPPGLVRNEERVRRFITEARSASSLNHPNIVTIHEIGHDVVKPARAAGGGAAAEDDASSDPVHFISMELVAGQTFDQLIHHERADLRTLLGYMAQAAEGVAKAHQAGIVHRDLKPGNIMVSKDGFAKVLDFGLAKLTERGSITDAERTSAPTEMAATGAGVVMGTVGYMSPEQVQARSVDHRSDIFSLGCILYEAATRRRPFIADSDVEVMHQIIKEKPPAIESLNPDVPGEVRRLIRRCLAKTPDQRFQSMKDVAIDLRELVEEWDTLSPSAPSGSTSASSTPSGAVAAAGGRGKALWAAIATAVVIGLGGLGFGLYGILGRGAPAAGGAATTQDLRMTVLMSRDDLSQTALSGDGRYLAYVTARDRKSTLSVRQVRTGSDVVILPGNESEISGISFSPDGDYLYYLNHDPDSPNYQALFQVASLGGSPRKLIFDVDSAATFSPDGRRICFRRGKIDVGTDTLQIADLDTGKERELLVIKNPDFIDADPAWSPDGGTILLAIQSVAGGVKSRVVAIDVASGKIATVGSRAWVTINTVGWMPGGRAVLTSALDASAGGAFQVFRIAYPGGEVARLTNDLDGYRNLSIAADGSTVAAIRRAVVDNLWVARVDTKQEPQPITFASGSAGSIGHLVPLPGGAAGFTAPKDNKVYVWRIDADGSNRRQLTTQGTYVMNAGFAQGAGVVFTQVEEGDNGFAHLWRMDPDGGGLRQITEGNGEELTALSRTGHALLFSRWAEPQSIWALQLDGTPPRRIDDGKAVEDTLISPDGTRVLTAVFEVVKGRMYPRRRVISIGGGEPESTFLLPPGINGPAWTPDGRALTYVDQAEGWNLMRRVIPDGKPERLTNFTDGQVVAHRWSPDGSRMVIHHRLGMHDSLFMLKSGETRPTLIAEFKTGRVSQTFWAPDAPILYFTYGSASQDVVMIAGIK